MDSCCSGTMLSCALRFRKGLFWQAMLLRISLYEVLLLRPTFPYLPATPDLIEGLIFESPHHTAGSASLHLVLSYNNCDCWKIKWNRAWTMTWKLVQILPWHLKIHVESTFTLPWPQTKQHPRGPKSSELLKVPASEKA